jgi:CheY-like chemotaxis protein
MRVLVIDDEPDVLEIVRLTFNLRWPDADVLSAGNGETGLELVEQETPDIVILDIGLPDLDGYQVLRRIRTFSDVPVVMLSARHEEVDKVKGLELGADDYVTSRSPTSNYSPACAPCFVARSRRSRRTRAQRLRLAPYASTTRRARCWSMARR